MYARQVTITSSGITEEKIQRAIDSYKEIVPADIRRLDGFEQVFMLVDRSADKIVSLSIWRDEESCEAGAQNAARLAQAVMQNADVTGDVSIDSYEVTVRA